MKRTDYTPEELLFRDMLIALGIDNPYRVSLQHVQDIANKRLYRSYDPIIHDGINYFYKEIIGE